tara:strand:+ start:3201 stop:4088 length:888 start_codon:yes stop_codon:yes gene_type:complete
MNEIVDIQAVQSDLDDFDYDRMISDPDDREWAETAAGFITFGLGQAVVKVLEAGNLLIEAKQRLAHGEYLPWVEQACGLKPQRAAELAQAAAWVQMSDIAGTLDNVSDLGVLFLLSAKATTEDVRQWALERCAAGDPPTRREVQERKRKAQGRPDRTLVQEALSALKLSEEARELAAKAQHISTRQLMDELGVEELPKGKEHKTSQYTFCKNGTGWWKFPIEQPVETLPIQIQQEISPQIQAVSFDRAAQILGCAAASIRQRLSPKQVSEKGTWYKNGYRVTKGARGLVNLEPQP